MRKLIYGRGNPQHYITRCRQGYLKDNGDVIEYFLNRDKLRVLDMENDNQVIAERLHKLLGPEHRDVPSPVTNKSEGRCQINQTS